MRLWIPLDLRNIKDIYTRSQLRRIDSYLNDLAQTLVSEFFTPSPPDNITQINNLPPATAGGGDAKNTVFYDDFLYDPQADPAPGASGVWRTGSQGAGGFLSTDEANLDLTAFGVHQFASATTSGDGVSIHMWARDAPTKPITLATGMEIGFRVRRDATDFTRAAFVVSISDGFPCDASATRGVRFLIYKSDVDFRFDAALGKDNIIFEAFDTSQTPTYFAFTAGPTSSITDFHNIKLIVAGSGVINCYIDGALAGTLSGVQTPDDTVKLNIQIFQNTGGSTNPGVTQKSYIDRFYIDVSAVDRGSN